MPDKKQPCKTAVNITVPFSHNGNHYVGVAVCDGVGISLVDAPCGPGRQLLSFSNAADAPTGIIWDGVTAVDDKSQPAQGYLKLKPAA